MESGVSELLYTYSFPLSTGIYKRFHRYMPAIRKDTPAVTGGCVVSRVYTALEMHSKASMYLRTESLTPFFTTDMRWM